MFVTQGIRQYTEITKLIVLQRASNICLPTLHHGPGRRAQQTQVVEALVGVISELGRLVGVPTPSIDMVYALVKQRAVEAGCVPE